MTACALDSHPARMPALTPDARLMVMQRDAETRSYRAVGFLDAVSDGYEFAYLRAAVAEPGFIPLLGFRDVATRYKRPYLFPLFAERVISARRPDRMGYLEALDLSEDAGPWEILAKSGGYRQGDSIELLQLPETNRLGQTSCTFLVHGVRYRGEDASCRISRLWRGEQLELIPDPTNKTKPLAVFVGSSGPPLGYVPNPLVGYIQALLPNDPSVTVVRANGPEVGPHMRLLVKVEGLLEGVHPFSGPDWETAA